MSWRVCMQVKGRERGKRHWEHNAANLRNRLPDIVKTTCVTCVQLSSGYIYIIYITWVMHNVNGHHLSRKYMVKAQNGLKSTSGCGGSCAARRWPKLDVTSSLDANLLWHRKLKCCFVKMSFYTHRKDDSMLQSATQWGSPHLEVQMLLYFLRQSSILSMSWNEKLWITLSINTAHGALGICMLLTAYICA